MELIYKGKTKDVFKTKNETYLLKFKDDVTGTHGVFDPGANTVGLSIDGMGKSNVKLSQFFFEKIHQAGIPTHYIKADIENKTMTVLPAESFGDGIECILRYKALGSFITRYGKYIKEGDPLDAYVEITLKDDQRNDPLITAEALDILGIMNLKEYKTLVDLSKKIGTIIKQELAKKELELCDIKFEFGRIGQDKHIALIDEISAGNMRVYKNSQYIKPLELEQLLLKN